MTRSPESIEKGELPEEHSRAPSQDGLDVDIDPELERRARRKLDWAVLPIMTMYYLLSFLDRSNIGNARVAGLQRDLGMTDHQYSIAVTVLFVPYIAAELPSNLLLRKIGPRILMPTLLTTWGTIVTLQGLVKSYASLVAVRALLGLVEGPMFPGIVLYLSGFYTRKELALRIAIFFSAASLSGAFSGLLAAAIVNMHGLAGLAGWSWIFILEGIFSVLVGVIGFFVTPSTPRDVRGLKPEEKEVLIRRLEKDRPSISPLDKFTFREISRSATSLHVVLVFVIFFMLGTILYGLANFLPSIVNQLGFSPNESQLLSVGPFAGGFLVTIASAIVSDTYHARMIPAMAISSLALIGYCMYFTAETRLVQYGALYFMVPGVYAGAPVLSAWMANNSEPYYRRATSIALGFVATNSGGILSTWMFPTREGPKFRRTTIINIVFACVMVVGSLVNGLYLARQNRLKRQNREKILAPYLEGSDTSKPGDGGIKAWIELGDRHPDFLYTI